jgi:type IV pilus assembly protein PilV
MEEHVMRTIALKDKKGFSLVEILISLVLLLIVFLALTQTAMVGIDSNMTNILRDEAVSIAEMEMNEARNIPFDNLADSNDTVPRNFRNIANFQYNVSRIVTPLGLNNKQIDITVQWDWKARTVANGNPYTHSITTIVRKP